MSDRSYFMNAMADFTFEVGSGGAIRHLADLGYTVKEIKEQLYYPVSYKKIQKTVWEYLLDSKIVLLEEPGSQSQGEKASYVREYDQYGKPSFRKVSIPDKGSRVVICWRELSFQKNGKESLAECLKDRCDRNGMETAYVSCGFGLKDKGMEAGLQVLEERQREYIMGLPWERKLCYHRLNQRMKEIVIKLYENGIYHGSCYFTQLQEKFVF